MHLILISGTCKKETGPEHVKVIQTTLVAVNNTWNHQCSTYQTVSITSDGESNCRDALVLLTMKEHLNSQSPIYSQLHQHELINHLVGEDDITADKDFKHVFKCQ
jgi:peroxiredoxin